MKNFETKQLLIDAKILSPLTGFEFTMVIADSLDHIKKEHTRLEEARKPSKAFETYQKAAEAINVEFSLKDEKGEPKIRTEVQPNGKPMRFYELDDSKKEERQAAVDVLEKKHKKVIDIQKKKDSAYNDALGEESKLKVGEIAKKQMPKNISVEQMMITRKLLKIKK